jgi:hypothetical protein
MEVTTVGGACRLSNDQSQDDSLELIFSELCSPLDVIKLSAEGLVQQLREEHGDPGDISAAEALIHSAEKMTRIIQALINASSGEFP